MKLNRIKNPKIHSTGVFQSKLRDEEDDLIASDAPASPEERPNKDLDEKDADKSGPAPHPDKTNRKHMAQGGKINNEVSMDEAEEDMVEHPVGLESDNDQMSPNKNEYMDDHIQMLAEGGIASEEEIEHAASIAAAIMARRKMAQGGEVDLDANEAEQPNHYDDLNVDEALDYNPDDSMSEGQPEDSNLIGDEEEEMSGDKMTKASKIRASIKRRSAITK